jgi:hypothetical protein
LLAIGIVAFWPRPKKPEYNGKKLNEWLNLYEESRRGDNHEQRVAADAIQHIGTNALPWLLKWIKHEPPAWKDRMAGFVEKIPSRTIARWYVEGDRLGFGAVEGFKLLGQRAAPEVPELEKIVKGSRARFCQYWAMDALSYIGRDAFPVLLAALENPKTKMDAATAICRLAREGVDIGPAIPTLLLLDRQTEDDEKKYKQTYRTLHTGYEYVLDGLLVGNRPFLIPALTNCLHHPNYDVRVEAAKALGRLGPAARGAAPALKDALDVRAAAVQEAAIDALEKIAPEVLTNSLKDF